MLFASHSRSCVQHPSEGCTQEPFVETSSPPRLSSKAEPELSEPVALVQSFQSSLAQLLVCLLRVGVECGVDQLFPIGKSNSMDCPKPFDAVNGRGALLKQGHNLFKQGRLSF
jgi:hypothetical protein